MGVLTTLPVLCMGLFAPVANQVARAWARPSAVGRGVATSSSAWCCAGWRRAVWSLYTGTFVAGAGIALAGTLLPGIVKAVFPARRAGLGTGLTMVAMMGAAVASAASPCPLATALGGWSRSLLVWAPVAALALVAWVPVTRAVHRHTLPDERARRRHPRPAVGQRHGLARRGIPHLPVVAVLLLARVARPDLRVARLERPRRRTAHGGLHRGAAVLGPRGTDPARPCARRPRAPRRRRPARSIRRGRRVARARRPPVALGAAPRGRAGCGVRARARPARPVCRDTARQRPAHRDGVPRQLHRRGVRARR